MGFEAYNASQVLDDAIKIKAKGLHDCDLNQPGDCEPPEETEDTAPWPS